ncbi:MAG: SAM-dependent methyltransferase [Vicinamibacterales bacterium]
MCYLLAEKAVEGKVVARLKWGDPFIFDSGGSEALFLHERQIRFEVVPGIPAAMGVAAYAGVPLTYPGGGDSLTFIRGNEGAANTLPDVDWTQPRHARRHDRLLRRARSAAGHARHRCSRVGGLTDDTAALIYDGTLPTQHTILGTLAEVAYRVNSMHRASTGDSGHRTRRGVARTSALVRRPPALRQACAGHAAA